MRQDLVKIARDHKLSEREQRALFYMAAHLDSILHEGVRGVAAVNDISPSTVMRLAKKMGYSGYTDMCYQMKRELTAGFGHDASESEEGIRHTIDLPAANSAALATLARRLHRHRGDIHTCGTGFSSLSSRYLARKLGRYGLHVHSSDGDGSVIDFESIVDRGDTVFLFSRSGGTKRTLEYARVAHASGATIVTVTADTNNQLRAAGDISLIITDDRPLDNRNVLPSFYFAACIMLIETLAEYYLQLESETG